MTTEKKVARRKLSLLELAVELKNVSRACRSGIGHTRPATGGSRSGRKKGYLKRFFSLWPRAFDNGAVLTSVKPLSTAPSRRLKRGVWSWEN